MKKILFTIAILMINQSFAQSLNQYKYALVPSKFSFLKENDQYHLNTLAKVYMKQYGFESYFDTDNRPDDFINMNCNKIYVDVLSNGGMFTTRLSVVLKDCKGSVLFTSKEGTSREKEYAVAYNQALRMAFESMQNLNYKYEPSQKSLGMIGEPAQKEVKQKLVVTRNDKFEDTSGLLYAQPTTNGFLIIDGSSKEIMKLFITSAKNYFIAIKNDTQGVLILNDKRWFFEYYENNKLISEEIAVQFY